MSTIVRKIYEFTPPLHRLAVIKFITIDWLIWSDFTLDAISPTCPLNSQMLENNEFYVNCDGFPIKVSFSEFTRGNDPFMLFSLW